MPDDAIAPHKSRYIIVVDRQIAAPCARSSGHKLEFREPLIAEKGLPYAAISDYQLRRGNCETESVLHRKN
jgi:hypothetical protein